MSRRSSRLCAVAVAALVGSGCSGGAARSSSAPPSARPAGSVSTTPPTSTSSAPPATGQLYVSLGDSYAAGYQPGASGSGATTRNGFAYLVPGAATAKGYSLSLVNFGCSGATVESMLGTPGCEQTGPDGQAYPSQTQAAAAERFLTQNRGRVALVTIVIGGNDVTRCALASDPVSCVTDGIERIKSSLGTLVQGVRTAAGPGVQILGLTYPDVVLGAWTLGTPQGQDLARLSVATFKDSINPALATAYASIGAGFIDVTSATGAYEPFDQMTTLAPYGSVPVPVAKVCQLTFFCDRHDIHPTNAGYKLISDLVASALKPVAPTSP